MIVQHLSIHEIDPEFSPKNYNVVWQKKVEIINGEAYHNLDHWSHVIVDKHKQFTTLGFYKNPDYPDELIRIAGQAPDLQVLLFRTKE